MLVPAVTVCAAGHNPYNGISMLQYDEVVGASSGFSSDERGFVRNLSGTAYLIFKNVNFGENGPVGVTLYSGTDTGYAGITTVRLDAPDGTVLATIQNQPAGWATATPQTGDLLYVPKGTHDLYIQNTTGICNMFRLVFEERPDSSNAYPVGSYEEQVYFNDIETSPYKNVINMLYEIGIVDGFSERMFEPKLYMSRGDFATVLYRILGQKTQLYIPFLDVSEDNPNSIAISWLYGAGIIHGDGNSSFRPYDFITTAEVATMAVCALGYEKIAKYQGGYPTGYWMIASEEGLFDNLSCENLITREQIAQFLYNFIRADYLEVNGIVGDSLKYVKKNGIMDAHKGIAYGQGIVMAVNTTGLSVPESLLGEDQVIIGETVYRVGESKAKALLGYDTDFYYQEIDGEKIITNIRPRTNVNVTEISTADVYVHKINEERIEYFDENGDKKTIDFDDLTYFVYNGKAADRAISSLLGDNTFSGTVKIVDNRKGYDAVFIEQHETMLAAYVDTVNKIVYNQDKTMSLNFGDKNTDISVFRDGEVYAFEKIPSGSILSIFRSKNTTGRKAVRVLVETETVTGTIINYNSTGVTIGEQEYDLQLVEDKKLEAGYNGIFYLNYLGEIVDFTHDKDATESMQVGVYLAGEHTKKGLYESGKLKIFTKKNQVEYFSCADVVKADGVKVNNALDLFKGKDVFQGMDAIRKETLIRYQLNEAGEISVIDTYLTGKGGEDDKLTMLSDTKTIYYVSRNLHTMSVAGGRTAFMFDEQPQLFSFWTREGGEDALYSPILMTGLNDEIGLFSEVYGLDPDTNRVDYVVWFGRENSTSYGYPVTFDELRLVADGEGGTGYRLVCKTAMGEKVYDIYDDIFADGEKAILKATVLGLEKGDVIRVCTKPDGTVSSILPVLLADGAANLEGQAALVNKESGVYGSDSLQNTRVVFGEIESKKDNFVTLNCSTSDGYVQEYFYLSDLTMVHVDGVDGEITNALSTANLVPGDKILICIFDRTITNVIRFDNPALN